MGAVVPKHVDTARTDELCAAFLRELRSLLDSAFDGDFSAADWQHVLGGTHAWVRDAQGIVAHGAVIPRRIEVAGRPLAVGYVEGVATRADRRRRGFGAAVTRALNEVIRSSHALGVLSTGEHGFYERLGWERWRGQSWVAAPSGLQRTPDDDDSLMILRTPASPPLDTFGAIVADWRAGDAW